MKAPDVSEFARRLVASADALTSLVEDVGAGEARWAPAPSKWSINEVFGHLADEERHDFRQRLRLLLEVPDQHWPAIDPEGRVREGNFNARELSDITAEFLSERQRSVAWLATLQTSNWEHAYRHPTAGLLTASSLLHAWAVHDLLHLRQIVAVRYARLAALAAPGSVDYAGRW